ncbi:MAG: ATP-binding protein [Myxococcales bacterium]
MTFSDPVRFDQILTNLLQDLHKHTEEHVALEVTLSPARGGVLIEARNSGLEVAPEELDHLFDRYPGVPASPNRRARGLGLYIAHRLVTLQGGTLEVARVPAGGYSFQIWLPGPPASPPNVGVEAHAAH